MPAHSKLARPEDVLSKPLHQTLLTDLFAHPSSSMPLREFRYFNPSLSSVVLCEALAELTDACILKTTQWNASNDSQTTETFYYLSSGAKDALAEQTDFLSHIVSLREFYRNIDNPQYKQFQELSRPPFPNSE